MVGIRTSICSCVINIEREIGLQQAVFEERDQNFGFEGLDEKEASYSSDLGFAESIRSIRSFPQATASSKSSVSNPSDAAT